jgi:hypothetical protein
MHNHAAGDSSHNYLHPLHSSFIAQHEVRVDLVRLVHIQERGGFGTTDIQATMVASYLAVRCRRICEFVLEIE